MAAEAVAVRQRIVEIFTKHNLDLASPPSRHAPPIIPSERAYKPIRMRVRYTCHCCQTSFGRDKECVGCQHRRCTRCDRYPPKKTPKQGAEMTATIPLEAPTQDEAAEEKACACHECQTEIVIGVDQCPNCHHTICERCHKETGIFDEPQQKTETAVAPSIDPMAKAPPESRENTEAAG